MRTLVIATLALSGCASRLPPPQPVRVEIQRVLVPTPVSCVVQSDIPDVPPRIGSKLNGNAGHDANLLAALAIDLRAALDSAVALLRGCEVRP